MAMNNIELANLLRNVAAVYEILGTNRFRIIAYQRAADSIEHLTSEAKDLWDDGKINDIPGIGPTIASHLDEILRTGASKHIDSVMKKVPASVFPLLLVPGIGPKKAYKLVTKLALSNPKTVTKDLEFAAKAHKIAPLDGFGEKSEADILENLNIHAKGQIKEHRMPLPEADEIAKSIISFLKKYPYISKIDVLGSLRRCVATIGDIDLAISTDNPEKAVKYFCSYPHTKIIEQGPTGASLLLTNGHQVDMRVQDKQSYGAMLQYFTGSKNHNIKLRTYALTKGMSLSEYGIKRIGRRNAEVGGQSITPFASEEKFYEYLGMKWIPPELREDRGEIEAAVQSFQGKKPGLPALVERGDIYGDCHMHTDFAIEPSHDLGHDPVEAYLDAAYGYGYEYIGVSDHNPSISHHTEKQIIDIMKRRKEYYEQHVYSWQKKTHKRVQLILMLEVDIQPNGTLALPEQAFDYVDCIIASVHSSFLMDKKHMTDRVSKALTAHPKVKIFGHPTGRILGKREGYELNWPDIFTVCKKHTIALEINAFPYRLDISDAVAYEAKHSGVSCIIDTDAHAVGELSHMQYGVSVARRGWLTAHDIINTKSFADIKKWIGM